MGDTVARDPDLAFPPVKQVAAFEIAKPMASIARWVAIRMTQRRIGYTSSSPFTS